MSLYPQERLYQEMAFLAYYLHWSDEALMALDHWERRRWCQRGVRNQQEAQRRRTERPLN